MTGLTSIPNPTGDAALAFLVGLSFVIAGVRTHLQKKRVPKSTSISADVAFPSLLDTPAILRSANVVDLAHYRDQVMFDRGDEVELADGRHGWIMGPHFRHGHLDFYSVRLQAGGGNAAVPGAKLRAVPDKHSFLRVG